mmetsp:Transcript_60662/g.179901  ORF Transcript_60662/g.179901 Transcript_60662/m.179901 type:complete len:98 (-) Transcript_60662:92-385(-)
MLYLRNRLREREIVVTRMLEAESRRAVRLSSAAAGGGRNAVARDERMTRRDDADAEAGSLWRRVEELERQSHRLRKILERGEPPLPVGSAATGACLT